MKIAYEHLNRLIDLKGERTLPFVNSEGLAPSLPPWYQVQPNPARHLLKLALLAEIITLQLKA